MLFTPNLLRFVGDVDGIAVTRHSYAAGARYGSLHRVARGVYMDIQVWTQLTPREQYLARVHAVASTRRARIVVSHESAALIHGLPVMGLPRTVHFTVAHPTSRQSSRTMTFHLSRLREDEIVEIDGFAVTSLERTVIDIAATCSFNAAVAVVDRALMVDRFQRSKPLSSRDRLLAAWESAQPMRAHTRVLRAIEFGESQAESALESVSRVSMWLLGCPRPRLQARHTDNQGVVGYSDFDWPEFGAIGEADGDSKYLDPHLRSGRSTEQVVLDEKHREDRLRELSRAFTRWRWADGVAPDRLRPKMLKLGLPLGKRWPIEGLRD